jgi:NhaP-type Na+/H+ or K+/H+ antiporter
MDGAVAIFAAAEGFSAGETYAFGLLFGGIALLTAIVAIPRQREAAFTAAMVYLVLGAILSAALRLIGVELLDPFDDVHVIERLTEIAVIIALFSAGLKLDRRLNWKGWRSAAVLLAVVMPVTIGAVVLLGMGLLGLSLGAAVILAGTLAPTDPVLAGDVQVGPPGEGEEPEPKFALTAEAGFNDGLAFPFVLLGVFIAGQGGTAWIGEWAAADVVYAVVVGLALGALLGRGLAVAVSHLHGRRVLVPELDGWLAMASVLVLYGMTEVVGAYGFLAAFAGGLAFRRYERHHEFHVRVHHGAETIEQFSELAIILLLGSTVTLAGIGIAGPEGFAMALAVLFLVRPLTTVLALAPLRLPLAERAFIGWFGIRGVGSFYYAAVGIGSGALAAGEAEIVYWTIIVTSGTSILLHGVTATPLVKRLGL